MYFNLILSIIQAIELTMFITLVREYFILEQICFKRTDCHAEKMLH